MRKEESVNYGSTMMQYPVLLQYDITVIFTRAGEGQFGQFPGILPDSATVVLVRLVLVSSSTTVHARRLTLAH